MNLRSRAYAIMNWATTEPGLSDTERILFYECAEGIIKIVRVWRSPSGLPLRDFGALDR